MLEGAKGPPHGQTAPSLWVTNRTFPMAKTSNMDIPGHVNHAQATLGSQGNLTIAPAGYFSPSCPPCRMTGFLLSLGVLALLALLGALGIASSFLDEYLDIDVAKKLGWHF